MIRNILTLCAGVAVALAIVAAVAFVVGIPDGNSHRVNFEFVEWEVVT